MTESSSDSVPPVDGPTPPPPVDAANDDVSTSSSLFSLNVDFTDPISLETFLFRHPTAVRIIQEFVLWHRPAPLFIAFVFLNVTFLLYRKLDITFYPFILLLFLGFQLLRFHFHWLGISIQEAWFPDPGASETQQKTEDEAPGRLRTPEELTQTVTYIARELKMAWDLTSDLRGHRLFPLALGILGFLASFGLRWFWVLVIAANGLLLVPGMCVLPQMREFVGEIRLAIEGAEPQVSKQ
jgi:hypothetical protein